MAKMDIDSPETESVSAVHQYEVFWNTVSVADFVFISLHLKNYRVCAV